RLRKVALKRGLDATLYRGVAGGAAAVIAASSRERDLVVACGVPAERVGVRGNGFPEPVDGPPARSALRSDLGIGGAEQTILYIGRTAAGKGTAPPLAACAVCPRLTWSSPALTTGKERPSSCAPRRRYGSRPAGCTCSARRSSRPGACSERPTSSRSP